METPVPGRPAESLRRVADGCRAPDQAEVASAQTTPVRLNQPPERSFQSVLGFDGSEIDGFAARAATGEEPEDGVRHDH